MIAPPAAAKPQLRGRAKGMPGEGEENIVDSIWRRRRKESSACRHMDAAVRGLANAWGGGAGSPSTNEGG
eukprot:353172-Chlamydomonas_euryale.AAC.2